MCLTYPSEVSLTIALPNQSNFSMRAWLVVEVPLLPQGENTNLFSWASKDEVTALISTFKSQEND